MDRGIVAAANKETRWLSWFCSIRPFQYVRKSALCHGVTDVVCLFRTVDRGFGYASVERFTNRICRFLEGTNVFVEGAP